MSNEDINMVTEILLGITNTDKNIRTNSINKLQELKNNLGALIYCLLEIAQNKSNLINNNNNNNINFNNINSNNNNNNDKIIKTSALVICRKILESIDFKEWENINEDIKNKIKYKSLEIYLNEKDESQKIKIGDVITQIIDNVSDNDEKWDDFEKLCLSILLLNPNDGNNFIQINSLLKLITDGCGFLNEAIKNNLLKFISYFQLIFQNNNLKLKSTLTNLISELISFFDEEEIKLLEPFLFNILQATLECFNNNDEENLKNLLETLIELSNNESKIFVKYFQDIFKLCEKIIDKKNYLNEKIRELAFELIVNLIEELPDLIRKKNEDLKILFSKIYLYSLEINNEIDNSWKNPSINNYDQIEKIEEENIVFSQGLIERIIETLDNDNLIDIINELILNFLNQNDWKFKYIGLLSLGNLSNFEDESFVLNQNLMNKILYLTKDNNLKVKFSSINCINKLSQNFNPNFQDKFIHIIIPQLIEIINKENSLRIQCEIIETFIYLIENSSCEKILPYVPNLLKFLFKYFILNIPIILKKLIIECLLEIFVIIEENNIFYAKKSFEIIVKYFIDIYDSKKNKILYGKLIENLTTIGPFIKEDYYKYIPKIVNSIIELVEGIKFNNDPIRNDLQNSLKKLIPILQNDFNDLLFNLVNTILYLIKIKPKIYISDQPKKEIEISELFNNENNNENLNNDYLDNKKNIFDIQTNEIDDFCGSLSLLNTLIKAYGIGFINHIDEIEKEITSLFKKESFNKIKTKSSKILSNLIMIVPHEKKREKGILYIKCLIEEIEKETNYEVYEKYFVNLKNLIDNSGEILEKNELNELFNKIMLFFDNIENKRLNLHNKINENENYTLKEPLKDEIQNLENIQCEIINTIGILYKTHKSKSNDIIKIILNKTLPKYLKSNSNFELKISLYLIDDLIEYIGQEILFEIWNSLFEILIKFIKSENCDIRQASAYGIGIFAKFTKKNFDIYAEKSIIALKEGMLIKFNKNNIDEDEIDFGYTFDNIISAFGKIIFYQFDSIIVQKYLNELIQIWISNLPIKYDNDEKFLQHELICNFFLLKKSFINQNLYIQFLKFFINIYKTKNSNQIINDKIIKIFNMVKNDEQLKIIIEEIYKNESMLTEKIQMLIK